MEEKVLYVDFDGVIGKFDAVKLLNVFKGADKIKLLKLFVHMSGKLPQSKKFKELMTKYQMGLFDGQESFLEVFNLYYPSLTAMTHNLLSLLPSTLKINDNMIQYLDEKRTQGYKVYIITNNLPENEDVILETANGHSDGVLFSTRVHCVKTKKGKEKQGKPQNDPTRIFDLANNYFGVKKNSVKAFIDDKEGYVNAAKLYGIPALTFDSKNVNIYNEMENLLNGPELSQQEK